MRRERERERERERAYGGEAFPWSPHSVTGLIQAYCRYYYRLFLGREFESMRILNWSPRKTMSLKMLTNNLATHGS